MADAAVSFERGVRGEWKPIRRGLLYRISLLAVAAMMLIVPLIYVGFIVGVGYLAYLHAINDYPIVLEPIKHLHGRAVIVAELLALAVYLGPLLAAGTLILLLLRPLFTRSDHERNVYTVTPAEEPALYAYVGSLCTFIGAPVPKRIDIDATPTASAHLDRGLLSVFLRGDLVLTIGMPLMHGMNLTEFSGVLAHEFGHFSQGAGMRAGVVIHRINRWVASVVMDASDRGASIGFSSDDEGIFGVVVKIMVKLSLWVTKLLFLALLFTAHLLSSIMSRQMEYDADRHEGRFAGAASFGIAFRRIMELSEGYGKTLSQIPDFWKNDKRLPDNIPAMVARASRRLTPEQRERVESSLTRDGAGWFSTHPATKDRISAVNAAVEPGVFALDVPALSLLRAPHEICVRASYGFYRSRLGGKFDLATMVPVAAFLEQSDKSDKAAQAAQDEFGFEAPTWRPAFLSINEIVGCPDPKAVFTRLKDAKAALLVAAPAARAAAERYRTSDEQLVAVELAQEWFESGQTALPKGFECAARNKHAVFQLRQKLLADAGTSIGAVDEAIEQATSRIVCALRLLHTKGVEDRIPNTDALRKRSTELVKVQSSLREVFANARTIRAQMTKAGLTLSLLQNEKTRDGGFDKLRRVAREVHGALDAIREGVQRVNYPYESPRGRAITIFEHLVDVLPSSSDPESVLTAGQTFLDRFPPLVHQVLHELAAIAIEVERAIAPAKKMGATAVKAS